MINRGFLRWQLGWFLFALGLVACMQNAATPSPISTQTPTRETAVAILPPSSTPTPPPTATPTATPPPTATATPTPTPTPTALPLTVTGDPRALQLYPPQPQTGAPCGLVDVFDFPLQPPDATAISGGRDFGIFRERFDKFHAGEDWWAANRSSTFGEPVYSIGHGFVTYAEPEGWNRDKGVIIIQHTFADGSQLLSFYGHLDPPSVTIQAGACVVRGQQIGQIGKPRGSPHLHFEIRQQSPYAPLSGYWPEDPTLVGWLPPSQTIWQQRISSAPGVMWIRPFAVAGSQPLGLIQENILVLLEDGKLVGIQTQNGRVQWQFTPTETISRAALDVSTSLVYLADQAGHIKTISLLPASEGELPTFTPLWQTQLAAVGSPTLIPMAQGGVLVSLRRGLFALAADGTLQWSTEGVGQPLTWAASGERVVLSTTSDEGPVWVLDEQSAQPLAVTGNGRLAASPTHTWFYRRDGLYHLNLETQTAELTYPLSPGMASLGDSAVLPDGGLLLAHADPFDRRLITFAPDGTIRWERSYNGVVGGTVRLIVAGHQVYLLAHESNNAGYQLTVFLLDMENMILTRVFVGGTRAPIAADNWVIPVGEQLLINIGGGPMFLLQPA